MMWPARTRLPSSEEAHKMFYYAMLCDGVGAIQALAMYEAVMKCGPEWKSRDTKRSATFSLKGAAQDLDVEVEFERLLQAAASAVEELGKDAALEALDRRVGENLAE